METIHIIIRVEKRLNLDGEDLMSQTLEYKEIPISIDKIPELLYDIFREFRTILVNALINPFSFLGDGK